MRILPLVFYFQDNLLYDRYEITKSVSSVTHDHIRSVISCFYYLEFANQILQGIDKFEIYRNLQTEMANHLSILSIHPMEMALFNRLLNDNLAKLVEDEIQSCGYVLHTPEASIW